MVRALEWELVRGVVWDGTEVFLKERVIAECWR
jgi:hypothetical protein